jgi:hypothetical protein
MIDYVNNHNGLIFWAHPEAENISDTKNVKIETKKHIDDFYDSEDYTGFSVFYEGYDHIGRPGALWDKVLNEFINGKRKKPVWAIGGLAFDYQPDLQKALKDLRNIVLLESVTEKSFLEALSKGRLYVIRGPRGDEFRLDDFYILDQAARTRKIMGQTLQTANSKVSINFKGRFNADPQDDILSIHLIKNGKIIQTFKQKQSFDIQYQDDLDNTGENCFYRLEIRSHGLHVVTNPIFCKG